MTSKVNGKTEISPNLSGLSQLDTASSTINLASDRTSNTSV